MATPKTDNNKIKQRDFIALARLISGIENLDEQALGLADELYLEPKYSHVIGITGLPGAGKSTLVNQLISHLVKADKTIAVLAIDPTSPFTGGAVLGDRIRYHGSEKSEGKVFFRSMASRGHRGGISNATADILHVFNAARFDFVIVETVGAGQLEVDIAYLTDTLVNVLTPEAGDDIQAIKAGIMEIGDIFVINKSDLPGADRKQAQLQMMLADVKLQSSEEQTWQIPVLKTKAENGEGIVELLKMITSHTQVQSPQKQSGRIQREILDCIHCRLSTITDRSNDPEWWNQARLLVADRKITPHQAAQLFLQTHKFGLPDKQ
ncbi:hypothetical protein AUK40_01620 [Candidatus Wirthbacteria bacterium CG2_30_54_11]|uniref:AAA+ ATPase domain-containing protein n=1 Tax=Candidatus Wirthbacteria bacterium CG2_30_54_11 TaxID=1817892 RepID=A0A1J5IVG5_9BACT|nr:MAG: hypothetical protein AUK40_01620 [Candidatus Wirthbacteria bacterium CG2_30_54_11]